MGSECMDIPHQQNEYCHCRPCTSHNPDKVKRVLTILDRSLFQTTRNYNPPPSIIQTNSLKAVLVRGKTSNELKIYHQNPTIQGVCPIPHYSYLLTSNKKFNCSSSPQLESVIIYK